MREHDYWVYIMTNQTRSTLYVGVTNDLRRRVAEHREGKVEGFTKRYRINRLVFFEHFNFVNEAIAFEKRIKGWRRTRKDELVQSMNPQWNDLAVTRLEFAPLPHREWKERS